MLSENVIYKKADFWSQIRKAVFLISFFNSIRSGITAHLD